jgi:hydroxymethylglutaryl-CoA lyase
MGKLPSHIDIVEEGPREGFQSGLGSISTEKKIELVDRLSNTGLKHIQVTSFVKPSAVPGTADAEAVVAGIMMKSGVSYTGLWLNEQGLERALATKRLHVQGALSLNASTTFLKRNQNRTPDEQLALQRKMAKRYKELGLGLERASIMAAFGCNFEGDIDPAKVVGLVGQLLDVAAEQDLKFERIMLADTMGWATPESVKRLVGAVANRFPEERISLHLHDTRGLGIANAYAGLEMGVSHFDSSVAGLGGCPFAGNKGAAGNVCTEDLVFMCEEMGIATGVDLEELIRCAEFAQELSPRPLPGSVMIGGTLGALRRRISAKAVPA